MEEASGAVREQRAVKSNVCVQMHVQLTLNSTNESVTSDSWGEVGGGVLML